MSSIVKRVFAIMLGTSILILAYVLWAGYQFIKTEPAGIFEQSTGSEEELFRFIVLSDNEGDTPIFQSLLQRISEEDAEFLVHLGDLTPRGAEDDFRKVGAALATLPFPYYTAIGNNDLGPERSRENYLNYFAQARPPDAQKSHTYYSFDYQNAHFIVLDNSDRRIGFEEEQLDWLAQDLAQQNRQWIFLFMHRPVDLPLSEYTGDDETAASRQANAKFVEMIKPYPITRIFAGHIHTLFSYSLGEIPVSISGGGGAAPQELIENIVGPIYHYLQISVRQESIDVEVIRLEE